MRTIIAGSRSIANNFYVYDAIAKSGINITQVVSGTAKGVDTMGEDWAYAHGVPVVRFPADWDKYGKRAGYLRNMEMAENADALICVWDGSSSGSKHMIDIATRRGLHVYVHNIGQEVPILPEFTFEDFI